MIQLYTSLYNSVTQIGIGSVQRSPRSILVLILPQFWLIDFWPTGLDVCSSQSGEVSFIFIRNAKLKTSRICDGEEFYYIFGQKGHVLLLLIYQTLFSSNHSFVLLMGDRSHDRSCPHDHETIMELCCSFLAIAK